MDDIVFFSPHSQQDDRNIGYISDAAADGEAVQGRDGFWQVHIQDNDVRLFVRPALEGSCAIISLDHLETLSPQRKGDQIGQYPVIVDHQRFHTEISLSISFTFATGIVNQKMAPCPGRFSAPTWPPWAVTIALTTDRPNPVPYSPCPSFLT